MTIRMTRQGSGPIHAGRLGRNIAPPAKGIGKGRSLEFQLTCAKCRKGKHSECASARCGCASEHCRTS